MGIIYAYVRVSSRTQNEQRQINSIKARYNIDDEHIIVEKASGKNYIGRTEYQKLRSTLEKSDLLVIASLDRLGRNMHETVKEWEYLTNKGVDIDVIDMPIISTRNNNAGLTGELINKLIITILSYVAEKERADIKERQKQGIENAKLHGTKEGKKDYGRPRLTELPSTFIKYYVRENYSANVVQKMCGISKATYYRYVRLYNEHESAKG